MVKLTPNFFEIYPVYCLKCIESKVKYEKLCFLAKDVVKNNEYGIQNTHNFIIRPYGPYDNGLTKVLKKYDSLSIIEIQEELDNKQPITYKIREKGEKWMEGIIKFNKKMDKDFEPFLKSYEKSISENGELTGSRIVKKEEIQEVKKNPWGKRV